MTRLNLVVLTSRALGIELASALVGLPEVGSLTVVTTKVVPRQTWARKLRRMYLHDGPGGLIQALIQRVRQSSRPSNPAELVARRCPGARHIHFDDLHAPDALDALRRLSPDLGVVFAIYRLGSDVFSIPRMGCLNLHLGRAPQFRGSSPAFYELLEGVAEVGVTVHRITDELDGGPILCQEVFPLDLAPRGDPMTYLAHYQAEVLVPNGIRMMAQTVRGLAYGPVPELAPEVPKRVSRRRATHRLKRELRRRVALRRPDPPPILRSGSFAAVLPLGDRPSD